MVVRIRLGKPRKRGPRAEQDRSLAMGIAALLTPAALMAAALGAWGIAADFRWTGSFAISSGLFSHWQVWLGGAALLQFGSYILNRYGRGGRTAS
ncbi:MAG: hypothetical protein C5B51_26265 [Terriglobia bacterium]|nr:MAG: hypothetical protein C5B51_26265 [Terriglobia bacterium]